jgi:hypothetical protein
VILLISASWVAKITGVSHWYLAFKAFLSLFLFLNLINLFSILIQSHVLFTWYPDQEIHNLPSDSYFPKWYLPATNRDKPVDTGPVSVTHLIKLSKFHKVFFFGGGRELVSCRWMRTWRVSTW